MDLTRRFGRGPVGLDTAAFIYLLEDHPRYVRAVEPIFAAIAGGHIEGVTSALTLLEVLVVPYRTGDLHLAERYEALLSRSRGLHLVDLDRTLLRIAARLRARFSVKSPDALQLAAAVVRRCTAFVTGDRRLPALPGLRIVRIAELA